MRRRASIPIALAGLAAILALGALGLLGQDGPDEGASPSGRREVLPPPATDGGMGLAAALSQRRSVRSFSGTPLTAAEIGQLLWAAQAVTDPPRAPRPGSGRGASGGPGRGGSDRGRLPPVAPDRRP